jgi:hypothetical protein
VPLITKKEKKAQIKRAIKITEDFIINMESLGEEKINEVNKLIENLEVMKNLNKLESKKNYLKILKNRLKEV